MKTKIPALGLILISALSLNGALSAADASSASSMKQRSDMDGASLSHADRTFFEKAAKSGMKEVSVSQAVSARLKNTDVAQFAQMMVSDHTAANTELTALAHRKGVTLPAADPKTDDKWMKKDKGLDEDYLEEMISDHKDAIDLFEKAAESSDADIAAFASKTLPTLREHLEKAQTLEKQVD
jgi:putative membrane protein